MHLDSFTTPSPCAPEPAERRARVGWALAGAGWAAWSWLCLRGWTSSGRYKDAASQLCDMCGFLEACSALGCNMPSLWLQGPNQPVVYVQDELLYDPAHTPHRPDGLQLGKVSFGLCCLIKLTHLCRWHAWALGMWVHARIKAHTRHDCARANQHGVCMASRAETTRSMRRQSL